MTTADEVQIWLHALKLHDNAQYNDAVNEFKKLNQSARIQFNIACCYLAAEDVNNAIQKFNVALSYDSHFALPSFIIAQLYYANNQFDLAIQQYEESHKNLRGNKCIDYRKLGLNYILHASEILLNQALLCRHLGNKKEIEYILMKALKLSLDDRKLEEIKYFVEKVKNGGKADIYRFPFKQLFQPDRRNAKNFNKKDFLGEAKVISTANDEEIYACFSGLKVPDKPLPVPTNHTTNQSFTFYVHQATTPMVNTNHLTKSNLTHHINQTKPPKPPMPPNSPALRNKIVKGNGDIRLSNDNNISRPERPPLPVTKPVSNKIMIENWKADLDKIRQKAIVSHKNANSHTTGRLKSEHINAQNTTFEGRNTMPQPLKPRKPLPIFDSKEHQANSNQTNMVKPKINFKPTWPPNNNLESTSQIIPPKPLKPTQPTIKPRPQNIGPLVKPKSKPSTQPIKPEKPPKPKPLLQQNSSEQIRVVNKLKPIKSLPSLTLSS